MVIALTVTVPDPVAPMVTICAALADPTLGTPNERFVGDTDTVCALTSTLTPARQQIAAISVIERTTTFHAIIVLLLEAPELVLVSRN